MTISRGMSKVEIKDMGLFAFIKDLFGTKWGEWKDSDIVSYGEWKEFTDEDGEVIKNCNYHPDYRNVYVKQIRRHQKSNKIEYREVFVGNYHKTKIPTLGSLTH